AGFSVLGFAGFDGTKPTDPRASYLAAVREAMSEAGPPLATIGVETRALPFVVGDFLRTEFPNARLVEAEPALQTARKIKTAREIALLRRTSQLADIAHATL